MDSWIRQFFRQLVQRAKEERASPALVAPGREATLIHSRHRRPGETDNLSTASPRDSEKLRRLHSLPHAGHDAPRSLNRVVIGRHLMASQFRQPRFGQHCELQSDWPPMSERPNEFVVDVELTTLLGAAEILWREGGVIR